VKSLKKRETPVQKEFPEPKKKANFDIVIISKSDNEIQRIFWRPSRSLQLNRFIERGELTNCLSLLESRGFCGETALFLLSCLQVGGGGA